MPLIATIPYADKKPPLIPYGLKSIVIETEDYSDDYEEADIKDLASPKLLISPLN